MRSQFFRLFFSIVLIIIVMSAVQICLFLGSRIVSEKNWKDRIFEEFIGDIETRLNEDAFIDDIMGFLATEASERISGFLLRGPDGEFIASFGVSSIGQMMPSPMLPSRVGFPFMPGRFKPFLRDSIEYESVSLKAPKYELSVSIGDQGPKVEIVKSTAKGRTGVDLPMGISPNDIAGTIVIKTGELTRGYLDVLVFKMNHYAPTEFAFRQLLLSLFVFAIPAALIISVILAFIVSKGTSRSTKEIQGALREIASGNFDVDIPDQKTREMEEIALSIESLGKDLGRYISARKEWIRNISHDLNTPIASLSLLINGIIDGVFETDESTMLSLRKELDDLSSRISSVDFYSNLLFPDRELNLELVRSVEIIDDVLGSGKYPCAFAGDDVVIRANRNLLTRALIEAVKNAVDYGRDAEISFKDGGDGIIIKVSNSGSLPYPRPQFFEPWARGDVSRSAGGCGMGLPIIHEIVSIHGGTVSIEESDGKVILTMRYPK